MTAQWSLAWKLFQRREHSVSSSQSCNRAWKGVSGHRRTPCPASAYLSQRLSASEALHTRRLLYGTLTLYWIYRMTVLYSSGTDLPPGVSSVLLHRLEVVVRAFRYRAGAAQP